MTIFERLVLYMIATMAWSELKFQRHSELSASAVADLAILCVLGFLFLYNVAAFIREFLRALRGDKCHPKPPPL